MKCIFIYNPNSGKGKTAKKLTYIVKKLKKRYASVDVYATKAKGDLTRKVAEVAEQYDCIVFSGGDDIAHSLGIPRKNVRKALNVILKGRRELLDCMRINGTQYAMYSISAGAFTSATYTTPQEAKRALGLLAYGLEGIRKNIPFRIFSVDATDGITRVQTESVFTLIMNSKCVAGLKMNKDASMRDGIMECAVIKQKAKPNLYNKARALLALGSLFVLGYRFREQDIERLQGNKLRIEVPDDVVWNYDGEKGASGSIEVEILSRKVPLLVPKNNKNI